MNHRPASSVAGALHPTGCGHVAGSPVGSSPFFFPDQFVARSALACLADVAEAQGVRTDATQLAALLGLHLPARLGVQDLIRAAEGLGLFPRLECRSLEDLALLPLPLMAFMASDGEEVQVVTHCDGRYVVAHSHGSVVPMRSMVPVDMLARSWACNGSGWVLILDSSSPMAT